MTWHAQAGPLVLHGDEAQLVREAVLSMCHVIKDAEDDEESCFETAEVFDRMSRTQQLAALEAVSRYLFHETAQRFPLTAWSEATLASILGEVRAFIEGEVGRGGRQDGRRAVLNALGLDDRPMSTDDHQKWSCLLDAYEDRFLWDADYADDGAADLPPKPAKQTREVLGISEDYYTAVPPDLRGGETLESGFKRVWMAIDGKKTFKLSATLTCELPASLSVEKLDDDLTVLHGALPKLELMEVDQDGNLTSRANDLQVCSRSPLQGADVSKRARQVMTHRFLRQQEGLPRV